MPDALIGMYGLLFVLMLSATVWMSQMQHRHESMGSHPVTKERLDAIEAKLHPIINERIEQIEQNMKRIEELEARLQTRADQ